MMKGQAACEKFLLRKDAIEAAILEVIQGRLDGLLNGDGEKILQCLHRRGDRGPRSGPPSRDDRRAGAHGGDRSEG